jgi:choline dehydrogenase
MQYHVVGVQIVDEGMADPSAHGMVILPTLLTPQSRGSVHVISADPTAKPVIRHNYYAVEDDMATQMAGVRQMLEIVEQPSLKPYCAEGFTVPDSDSDEDVRSFVARNTSTLYHPVGTCAIGTVVDAELRVRGVEGLRVVDASVMPVVPRGNTNAPTIAIAERAADLLRGRTPERAAAAAATA